MEEFSLKVKLEKKPTADFISSISKATEKDLSSVIEVLEAHLDLLYMYRRGKIISHVFSGGDESDLPIAGPGTHPETAWCCLCGKVKVSCLDGIDTCRICLEKV